MDIETSASSPEAVDGAALRAWLHLANLQFTPRLLTSLLQQFQGDPQAVLAASDAVLEEIPGFQSKHLVRLRDPACQITSRQWRWMERYGVRVITPDSPEYSSLLSEIPDPPPFFFARGQRLSSGKPHVGLVGSRHATAYGKRIAEHLGRELSERGLCVVSGGAVGIDAAAHRGAVNGGGPTLAVLGCGLDVDYPRENRTLFEQVLAHGTLISEYPLGAQPESWRFPMRNRIISGLSAGILVVEAPARSGALITAECAVEHGRILMTVPGNIDHPNGVGSNALLKEGAVPILEADDVLRALDLIPVSPRPTWQPTLDLGLPLTSPAVMDGTGLIPKRTATPPLTPVQQRLLDGLSLTPRHIDEIARTAGISAMQAGAEMTLLELTGLTCRLPGNAYIRVG